MDKERKEYCTHKRLRERYFRRPGPYFGSPQINRTGGVEKCTGNEGRNKREKDIYIYIYVFFFLLFTKEGHVLHLGVLRKGREKKSIGEDSWLETSRCV